MIIPRRIRLEGIKLRLHIPRNPRSQLVVPVHEFGRCALASGSERGGTRAAVRGSHSVLADADVDCGGPFGDEDGEDGVGGAEVGAPVAGGLDVSGAVHDFVFRVEDLVEMRVHLVGAGSGGADLGGEGEPVCGCAHEAVVHYDVEVGVFGLGFDAEVGIAGPDFGAGEGVVAPGDGFIS